MKSEHAETFKKISLEETFQQQLLKIDDEYKKLNDLSEKNKKEKENLKNRIKESIDEIKAHITSLLAEDGPIYKYLIGKHSDIKINITNELSKRINEVFDSCLSIEKIDFDIFSEKGEELFNDFSTKINNLAPNDILIPKINDTDIEKSYEDILKEHDSYFSSTTKIFTKNKPDSEISVLNPILSLLEQLEKKEKEISSDKHQIDKQTKFIEEAFKKNKNKLEEIKKLKDEYKEAKKLTVEKLNSIKTILNDAEILIKQTENEATIQEKEYLNSLRNNINILSRYLNEVDYFIEEELSDDEKINRISKSIEKRKEFIDFFYSEKPEKYYFEKFLQVKMFVDEHEASKEAEKLLDNEIAIESEKHSLKKKFAKDRLNNNKKIILNAYSQYLKVNSTKITDKIKLNDKMKEILKVCFSLKIQIDFSNEPFKKSKDFKSIENEYNILIKNFSEGNLLDIKKIKEIEETLKIKKSLFAKETLDKNLYNESYKKNFEESIKKEIYEKILEKKFDSKTINTKLSEFTDTIYSEHLKENINKLTCDNLDNFFKKHEFLTKIEITQEMFSNDEKKRDIINETVIDIEKNKGEQLEAYCKILNSAYLLTIEKIKLLKNLQNNKSITDKFMNEVYFLIQKKTEETSLDKIDSINNTLENEIDLIYKKYEVIDILIKYQQSLKQDADKKFTLYNKKITNEKIRAINNFISDLTKNEKSIDNINTIEKTIKKRRNVLTYHFFPFSKTHGEKVFDKISEKINTKKDWKKNLK